MMVCGGMAIEIGDLVAGRGGFGRVIEMDGHRVTVMPFPPQDKPDLKCIAVVVEAPLTLIAKGQPRPLNRGIERER